MVIPRSDSGKHAQTENYDALLQVPRTEELATLPLIQHSGSAEQVLTHVIQQATVLAGLVTRVKSHTIARESSLTRVGDTIREVMSTRVVGGSGLPTLDTSFHIVRHEKHHDQSKASSNN